MKKLLVLCLLALTGWAQAQVQALSASGWPSTSRPTPRTTPTSCRTPSSSPTDEGDRRRAYHRASAARPGVTVAQVRGQSGAKSGPYIVRRDSAEI